jgi:MoaA/NifB/PqqE/SkfB family radical SAM enzyme
MILGLYLTYNCNQQCPYCFKKHVPDKYISDADFKVFCDWVAAHRPSSINIAGGEPSTHPCFVRFMRTLRQEAGLPIQIISNLICDEELLKGYRHCNVLANTSPPHSAGDRYVFEQNLEKLVREPGTRVMLSHTLYDEAQDDAHIVEYCKAFDIVNVRLDFARASLLRKNRHLTLDTVGAFKERIVVLGRILVSMGVAVRFDCPMPRGIFSDRDLRALRLDRTPLVEPDKNTCFMLYVNPDLTISSCPFRVIDARRLDAFANMGSLFATVGLAVKKKLEAEGKEGPVLCMAERFM